MQDPSPDPALSSTVEGAVLWYDYVGKPSGANYEHGTDIMPSVEARVMPDGKTWYRSYTRNSLGKPLTMTEKWWNGTAYQTRTESHEYTSDKLDLVKHTDFLGNVNIGYAYDSSHPHLPIRMTNAVGITQFTYDSPHRLDTTINPYGGKVANVYYGSGSSAHNINRLYYQMEYIGTTPVSTNFYTWQNGLMKTHTDPRGLVVTYNYDSLGRLTSKSYPDSTSETHLYTFQAGHGYANLAAAYPSGSGGTALLDRTAVIDRLGQTTYYSWDQERRLASDLRIVGVPGRKHCRVQIPADDVRILQKSMLSSTTDEGRGRGRGN